MDSLQFISLLPGKYKILENSKVKILIIETPVGTVNEEFSTGVEFLKLVNRQVFIDYVEYVTNWYQSSSSKSQMTFLEYLEKAFKS